MKYTEPADVEYDDYIDEDGERCFGFITEPVDCDTTFGKAVLKYILRATKRSYGHPKVLMTTRECWSGYSEYTITNTWDEVVLTVPEWNWEHEWDHLGAFLKDVAEANPERDFY